MCMETIVITLCTWFFLSHTEHDREGKTKYRRIAAVLYCAGLAGLTVGLADGRPAAVQPGLDVPVLLFSVSGDHCDRADFCGLYDIGVYEFPVGDYGL